MIKRERADLHQPPHPVTALDVKHGTDGADRLPSDRGGAQIGERAQRLKARRHIVERVRVQGSGTTIVPGVQRAEQFANLGAATFAEHESVRAHPQGLTQQAGKPQPTRSLKVGLPSFESHEMWMPHPKFGRLHIRIQSWFPFRVQVCMNGREWLAKQMDEAGIEYVRQDNAFGWVADFDAAQRLLDEQGGTNWPAMLSGLLREYHPAFVQLMEQLKLPEPY